MDTPYGDIPDRLARDIRPQESGPAEATDDRTDRKLAEPRGDMPGQGPGADPARPHGFRPMTASQDRAAAQSRGEVVQYPSTDRCFALQVAAPFLMQAAPGRSVPSPEPHRGQRRAATRSRISRFRSNREPDEPNGADTSSAARHVCRVRLPADVSAAAMTANCTDMDMDEDLMTRRQVAVLFRVTSASVASWARRGHLPEVRNETGRPRYRRADVEALFRSGLRRRSR
jgi:MerR HTH family regulatory protein